MGSADENWRVLELKRVGWRRREEENEDGSNGAIIT